MSGQQQPGQPQQQPLRPAGAPAPTGQPLPIQFVPNPMLSAAAGGVAGTAQQPGMMPGQLVMGPNGPMMMMNPMMMQMHMAMLQQQQQRLQQQQQGGVGGGGPTNNPIASFQQMMAATQRSTFPTVIPAKQTRTTIQPSKSKKDKISEQQNKSIRTRGDVATTDPNRLNSTSTAAAAANAAAMATRKRKADLRPPPIATQWIPDSALFVQLQNMERRTNHDIDRKKAECQELYGALKSGALTDPLASTTAPRILRITINTTHDNQPLPANRQDTSIKTLAQGDAPEPPSWQVSIKGKLIDPNYSSNKGEAGTTTGIGSVGGIGSNGGIVQGSSSNVAVMGGLTPHQQSQHVPKYYLTHYLHRVKFEMECPSQPFTSSRQSVVEWQKYCHDGGPCNEIVFRRTGSVPVKVKMTVEPDFAPQVYNVPEEMASLLELKTVNQYTLLFITKRVYHRCGSISGIINNDKGERCIKLDPAIKAFLKPQQQPATTAATEQPATTTAAPEEGDDGDVPESKRQKTTKQEDDPTTTMDVDTTTTATTNNTTTATATETVKTDFDALFDFASLQKLLLPKLTLPQPIVFEFQFDPQAARSYSPGVLEIEYQVPFPADVPWWGNWKGGLEKELEALDTKLAQYLNLFSEHKRRYELLAGFSANPIQVIEESIIDMGTRQLRIASGRDGDQYYEVVSKSEVWHDKWVDDATLLYHNDKMKAQNDVANALRQQQQMQQHLFQQAALQQQQPQQQQAPKLNPSVLSSGLPSGMNMMAAAAAGGAVPAVSVVAAAVPQQMQRPQPPQQQQQGGK